MQKSHGLFIPDQKHLAIDLETLFEYLHLVIFGYRECIGCGTSKATVQAIQQHMTDKGHCKFDISAQDSEFAEFYDFSELEDEVESDIEGDRHEGSLKETPTRSMRKPVVAVKDSIHLPSGRIISKKSSTQAEKLLLNRLKRRNPTLASRLEYSAPEPDDEEGLKLEEFNSDSHNMTISSRREKREKAVMKYQLSTMSASDRNSLMHLSVPQQRSILAIQHRQAKRAQKEEQRRQGHIDQKGNKNLYAYWATETPVYLCG